MNIKPQYNSSDLNAFLERHQRKFMPEPNSGCWLWTAGNVRRYGRCFHAGTVQGVTRIIYRIANGEIPPDKPFICHKCDTPECINPDHLVAGSHQDNMDDMVARDRHPRQRGVEKGLAILADEDVIEIRNLKRAGVSYRALARKFNVGKSTIYSASVGLSWTHVTTPVNEPKRKL